MKSRLLQVGDAGWKIHDFQDYSIPAARLLPLALRHWTRPGGGRTAAQHLRVTKRDARKRGELLVFQLEPEVLCIERDGASDILHLISDAVNAPDEGVWLSLANSSGL